MYVVTPRCAAAAAAVVPAVVLRRPTKEYTHPYSMMHRRLPTAGIEVAPHYHQLLVYVIVEKLIKDSPVGSKAQRKRKKRRSFSYLLPSVYLAPKQGTKKKTKEIAYQVPGTTRVPGTWEVVVVVEKRIKKSRKQGTSMYI